MGKEDYAVPTEQLKAIWELVNAAPKVEYPPDLVELTQGAVAVALLLYKADKKDEAAAALTILTMAWFHAGREYKGIVK